MIKAIAVVALALVTKTTAPDGTHVLIHEAVVDAPPSEVWPAVSTAEGWKSWAVPVAWASSPDVIETSYARTAVLLRLPERLMVFRTVKAPAGFPDFETYARVVNALELEPVGETRTRIRLTATNYADSEAGRRLLAFFERGNSEAMEALKARFARSAPEPLRAELEPLRFLVGHCWRGEFARTGQKDTHCFDSVYGGRHVRDRHEVTGKPVVYRGETLYSWDGEGKRVDYTYWNSLGGVSRGAMVAKPGVLDFGREEHRRADGTRISYSTMWRRVGDDAYEAVSASSDSPSGERVVRYVRID
jgi:hypothetical protein